MRNPVAVSLRVPDVITSYSIHYTKLYDNLDQISVVEVENKSMSKEEIEQFIDENFSEPLVFIA